MHYGWGENTTNKHFRYFCILQWQSRFKLLKPMSAVRIINLSVAKAQKSG